MILQCPRLEIGYAGLDVASRYIDEVGFETAQNETYVHLVAYVGEVMRARTQGQWMIATANGPQAYPYIAALKHSVIMGGTDSKISDVRFAAGQFDWSPDGRFIVAGISQRLARQQPAGLYLLPVAGGTPRRLTTPKVVTDQAPAFSCAAVRAAAI